jgi:hypothetical protein
MLPKRASARVGRVAVLSLILFMSMLSSSKSSAYLPPPPKIIDGLNPKHILLMDVRNASNLKTDCA